MKGKITKRLVDGLKPEPRDYVCWDTELAGFGLKVTPKGRKIYLYQYRYRARRRRYTIGPHGTWTPTQARDEATRKARLVDLGRDPHAEKAAERSGLTVAELCAKYLEFTRPLKKPLSRQADRRMIEKTIAPFMGHLDAGAVSGADVARLHHQLRDTPVKANRVLALISHMMNQAEAWQIRPPQSNPAQHVKRYPERKRERYLSPEELGRLGRHLAAAEKKKSVDPIIILALRLLIFTGCRKNEILCLTWKEVDFHREALLLGDSKTGAKLIPLSAPALELLKAVPRIEGNPYVCPGRKDGGHLVGLQKAWERIRREAGLEDVRIHDLRHSFASVGAGSGLGLPILGALMGHRKASTTQRYAHLATDPLQKAANQIAGELDRAMRAPAASKESVNG